MPVEYRIDILKALKEAGYTTTRLRKEKILGEATVQRLREKKPVSYNVLAKLCKLLKCDVGYLLVYREGQEE